MRFGRVCNRLTPLDLVGAVTLALLLPQAAATGEKNEPTGTSYGLDVSFPIHHPVSTNYPWLPHNQARADDDYEVPEEYEDMPLQPLGDRETIYYNHVRACRETYSDQAHMCDSYEYQRLTMNQRQPQSMKNYTAKGFQVIRAPDHVVELVSDFWRNNHFKGKLEVWKPGNIYINHWDSPTYLISVDDAGLRGSGAKLKEHIWGAASATLESWTSEELQPCSLYGIRVYGEGAMMLPHVNRLPLVVSAVLNVAQDVDEDWPTEVYDHDGNAHNVTLHPGDMLLFESSSVIHGHPFPLKGRFYASIFIHFEPTGHSLMHNASGYFFTSDTMTDVNKKYRDSVESGVGGWSSEGAFDLPPYINRFTPEEENWKKEHPNGWKPPYPTLPPEAHIWAKQGSFQELESHLNKQDPETKKTLLSQRDDNGWQILHQGVVSGNADVVELLVKSGAEINSRTHGGYGETPLRMAEKMWGAAHPIVRILKKRGALSIGPEL